MHSCYISNNSRLNSRFSSCSCIVWCWLLRHCMLPWFVLGALSGFQVVMKTWRELLSKSFHRHATTNGTAKKTDLFEADGYLFLALCRLFRADIQVEHASTYIQTRAHTQCHTHTYTHTLTCTHKHVHTQAHTRTQTHSHTHRRLINILGNIPYPNRLLYGFVFTDKHRS